MKIIKELNPKDINGNVNCTVCNLYIGGCSLESMQKI